MDSLKSRLNAGSWLIVGAGFASAVSVFVDLPYLRAAVPAVLAVGFALVAWGKPPPRHARSVTGDHETGVAAGGGAAAIETSTTEAPLPSVFPEPTAEAEEANAARWRLSAGVAELVQRLLTKTVEDMTERFSAGRDVFPPTFSSTEERIVRIASICRECRADLDDQGVIFCRLEELADGLEAVSAGLRSKLVEIRNSTASANDPRNADGRIDYALGEELRELADNGLVVSINASIEAARAGKEGAGFSVIARAMHEYTDRVLRISGEISREHSSTRRRSSRRNLQRCEPPAPILDPGETLWAVDELERTTADIRTLCDSGRDRVFHESMDTVCREIDALLRERARDCTEESTHHRQEPDDAAAAVTTLRLVLSLQRAAKAWAEQGPRDEKKAGPALRRIVDSVLESEGVDSALEHSVRGAVDSILSS